MSDNSKFIIENTIAFKVLRMAAITHKLGEWHFSREIGLSVNEWRVIGLVGLDGWERMSFVRRMLLLDKGQLSRVVKSLTDQKLVEMRPDPENTRWNELRLTERGRGIFERGAAFIKVDSKISLSVLTEAEQALYKEMTDKLIEHNETRVFNGAPGVYASKTAISKRHSVVKDD